MEDWILQSYVAIIFATPMTSWGLRSMDSIEVHRDTGVMGCLEPLDGAPNLRPPHSEKMGKPCKTLNNPMGTQWESNGNPMGTQWEPNGNPLGTHWEANVNPMETNENFHRCISLRCGTC